MNRRDLLKNAMFSGLAVTVGLQSKPANALDARAQEPESLHDPIGDRVKNIRVFIDYLPDGDLPLVGREQKNQRLPQHTKDQLGFTRFDAWNHHHPIYVVNDGGMNIVEMTKPRVALVTMFEIGSNPVDGKTSSPEDFSFRAAGLAGAQLRMTLGDRVKTLVESAHARGHEVNQVYVPVRTPLCCLQSNIKDNGVIKEAYQVFANLGMAAMMTTNPVGVQNPWWYDCSKGTVPTDMCPDGLTWVERAQWVEHAVANKLGMRPFPRQFEV